jgi:DNA invertase Pin-like site-specific DNA recombinase
MKAFSYLRVSSKGQVDGDGFDRQRDKIQKWAKANGVQIVQEFVEAGVSGAKELEDRPALSALFAALNGVRTVIVERADRLSRDLMAGEIILAEFRKAGVAVIEAEDGRNLSSEDPDNPTGTLIRQILAAVAQFDKAGIVSKLRKARERKRREDGRCEGQKPFGDRPGEPDTIARMRHLRRKPVGKAKRMSFAKIAATLQAEGYPTRTGKPWAASSVRDILGR